MTPAMEATRWKERLLRFESLLLSNSFDAGEQTLSDWVNRVLASGFTRRLEAGVWVKEVEAINTRASRKGSKDRGEEGSTCASIAQKSKAEKGGSTDPRDAARKCTSLWQLPMMIGQKTAEKYLQIAMDKKQRTVNSVVLAPVNATREVLSTYRKGGLPIPSILTKDD